MAQSNLSSIAFIIEKEDSVEYDIPDADKYNFDEKESQRDGTSEI